MRKKLSKENIKNTDTKLIGIWIIFMILVILCAVLIMGSSRWLFSENMSDLFPFFIIVLCALLFTFIAFCLSRTLKTSLGIVMLGGVFLLFGGEIYYLSRGVYAFIYDNSTEVVLLNEKLSLDEAKYIKKQVDYFFEYDYDDVFSRNIIINGFHRSEDKCTLYIQDTSLRYTLKLYLDLENTSIKNIYWLYDNSKLFLVENGKKTESFEYYYAAYLTKELIGSQVSGVPRLEDAVEEKVKRQLNRSMTTLFAYEELFYDVKDGCFYLDGSVDAMDDYGQMTNTEFVIKMWKKEKASTKGTWYYGDSSFDYVEWDVSVK